MQARDLFQESIDDLSQFLKAPAQSLLEAVINIQNEMRLTWSEYLIKEAQSDHQSSWMARFGFKKEERADLKDISVDLIEDFEKICQIDIVTFADAKQFIALYLKLVPCPLNNNFQSPNEQQNPLQAIVISHYEELKSLQNKIAQLIIAIKRIAELKRGIFYSLLAETAEAQLDKQNEHSYAHRENVTFYSSHIVDSKRQLVVLYERSMGMFAPSKSNIAESVEKFFLALQSDLASVAANEKLQQLKYGIHLFKAEQVEKELLRLEDDNDIELPSSLNRLLLFRVIFSEFKEFLKIKEKELFWEFYYKAETAPVGVKSSSYITNSTLKSKKEEWYKKSYKTDNSQVLIDEFGEDLINNLFLLDDLSDSKELIAMLEETQQAYRRQLKLDELENTERQAGSHTDQYKKSFLLIWGKLFFEYMAFLQEQLLLANNIFSAIESSSSWVLAETDSSEVCNEKNLIEWIKQIKLSLLKHKSFCSEVKLINSAFPAASQPCADVASDSEVESDFTFEVNERFSSSEKLSSVPHQKSWGSTFAYMGAGSVCVVIIAGIILFSWGGSIPMITAIGAGALSIVGVSGSATVATGVGGIIVGAATTLGGFIGGWCVKKAVDGVKAMFGRRKSKDDDYIPMTLVRPSKKAFDTTYMKTRTVLREQKNKRPSTPQICSTLVPTAVTYSYKRISINSPILGDDSPLRRSCQTQALEYRERNIPVKRNKCIVM